jgi:ABC-type multidrug transport system fused ATPase/permease subunit
MIVSLLFFKTDAKLRNELKKETKDSTVIIVAQRIGTILNADQHNSIRGRKDCWNRKS